MSNSATQPIQARPRVQILGRRLTCVGMQYRVEDDLGVEIVTITEEGLIGCSCIADKDYITCSHIEVVEAQEKLYHEQAKQREAFVELFCIYG